MFSNTLEEVMELQKDRFPHRKLPWIQVTLSQQVTKQPSLRQEQMIIFFSTGVTSEW